MNPTKLIQAELSAPHIVEVSKTRKTVTIDALCRLHNDSEHDYVLGADDHEASHHWQIFDQNHKEIVCAPPDKARRKRGKTHAFTSKLVPSGHSVSEALVITLPTAKLKEGERYQLRSVVWGQPTDTDFFIVQQKATAAKRPAKKSKKKAASKKQTTSKARKK